MASAASCVSRVNPLSHLNSILTISDKDERFL
jgi:hypothetical protein